MGFLEKLFGIDKIHKRLDSELYDLRKNLKTSWNWINYLHELEQDNKAKIKQLMEENKELKELIKELSLRKEEHNKVEVKEEQSVAEPVPAKEEVKERSDIAFKEVDVNGIGKKEVYILQILYQLACFDSSSSIETSKIYENLPYSITKRGLRKKLYKLQEKGIISSVSYGNSKRWYLDMGKLAKLKEFLAKRA